MKAAEKSEPGAALYPEDFRIVRIGVGTKKNDGGSVFGGCPYFLFVIRLSVQSGGQNLNAELAEEFAE